MARKGQMRTPRTAGAGSEPSVGGADAQLVRAALDGDGEAYDVLYRRYRDEVARTAYLLMRDVHLAEDVAQEAFLVGWRDLGRLRDRERFRAWLTGIAANLSRRRSGGFRILPRRGAEMRGGLPERPAGSDESTAADLRLTVGAAIAGLPKRMQEVVVLRFYSGLTESEVAGALGIAVGTVKSRVARARKRLAAALGEELVER